MTDYFSGYEIVKATKNFLVTCEDDADARLRAQCIGDCCEDDLRRLNDLFSTNFESGKTSPHGIWVVVLKDDPTSNANGWNYGYETEQSSQIWIRRGFMPPPPSPPSLLPPDPPPLPSPNLDNAMREFPRAVFVAELAEILMLFTGYGWYPGNSPGEGLSVLLGALLHPAGYYDTQDGPRIHHWLQGGGPENLAPLHDFVSKTVNTDKDVFSYGCAILFINYLVSQRGFSLKQVIRAGGNTLAETYARVTGEAASAAYGALKGLLLAHIVPTPTIWLARDNIFPLQDVEFRSVQITVGGPSDMGQVTDTEPTSWVVTPGIICGPGKYDFFRNRGMLEQPLFARARGMAKAAFRWLIEGVEVTKHGQWTNVTANSPLTVKNPDGTITHVANVVRLNYEILDVWNGSVLYLKTVSWDGNFELNITVAAKEDALNETEVTAEESVFMTAVTWLPGEDLKKAIKRCNPYYSRVNDSFWYLTAKLSDVKNRPDPSPELNVREIVQAVAQLQSAVALYAKAGHQDERAVWRHLGTPDGLQSPYPVPAPVDMTRLRPRDASQGQGAQIYGKDGLESESSKDHGDEPESRPDVNRKED